MFSSANRFGIIITQLISLILFIVLTMISLELMWIRYFNNGKLSNNSAAF